MKIGFNLLLWTGHVTDENFAVIEKLKAAGYDGVEIPIFDMIFSTPLVHALTKLRTPFAFVTPVRPPWSIRSSIVSNAR